MYSAIMLLCRFSCVFCQVVADNGQALLSAHTAGLWGLSVSHCPQACLAATVAAISLSYICIVVLALPRLSTCKGELLLLVKLLLLLLLNCRGICK